MFAALYGQQIEMNGSILGFPELHAFELLAIEEVAAQAPFAYLRSMEDPDIGFLVADPFSFYSDYQINLADQDKEMLAATKSTEITVFAIVTIAEPFAQSTLNLLAPILVHVKNRKGIQIVLPPDSPYSTRMPLPVSQPTEEGGVSC